VDYIPQLLAVIAVFSLLGITMWWLKKKGLLQVPSSSYASIKSGRPRGILHRVETVRLSPTHSLNLVRMGDRAVLIGTCSAGFYLVESSSWKTLKAQSDEVTE
jgi:hypothetical protein